MRKKISNFGFTLIELLVVISIIGILATLLIARYGQAEKSARDTQRKSDLNQYRIALENYAAVNNGKYPVANTNCAHELCNSGGPLVSFMSICPRDPLFAECPPGEGGRSYNYASNATGDKYLLYVWGGLEAISGKTWAICWDGKAEARDAGISDWWQGFCPL